jgi:hypothetical protein
MDEREGSALGFCDDVHGVRRRRAHEKRVARLEVLQQPIDVLLEALAQQNAELLESRARGPPEMLPGFDLLRFCLGARRDGPEPAALGERAVALLRKENDLVPATDQLGADSNLRVDIARAPET